MSFIQAIPKRLVDHLVEDHSVVDPSYVEDFLLTYRTFFNEPTDICSQLLDWFDIPDLRDKVNSQVPAMYIHSIFSSNLGRQVYW